MRLREELKHLFELFLFLFENKKPSAESLAKLFKRRKEFIKKPTKNKSSDRFKSLKKKWGTPKKYYEALNNLIFSINLGTTSKASPTIP